MLLNYIIIYSERVKISLFPQLYSILDSNSDNMTYGSTAQFMMDFNSDFMAFS